EDHCFAWSVCDKFAQLILWRNAGRRIVRVADINQPVLGRSRHFWQIVSKAARQRNFDDVRAIGFRIFKNCFESWIGGDESALGRSSESLGAKFQNLARAVTKHNLIGANAVEFRQALD